MLLQLETMVFFPFTLSSKLASSKFNSIAEMIMSTVIAGLSRLPSTQRPDDPPEVPHVSLILYFIIKK